MKSAIYTGSASAKPNGVQFQLCLSASAMLTGRRTLINDIQAVYNVYPGRKMVMNEVTTIGTSLVFFAESLEDVKILQNILFATEVPELREILEEETLYEVPISQ